MLPEMADTVSITGEQGIDGHGATSANRTAPGRRVALL